MRMTPDEIAQRAFTPSADGYHKAEVRSFLERIAAQVTALQAPLPEGQAGIADLALAVQDHEPQLTQMQQRLGDIAAELEAVTGGLREAQAETATTVMSVQSMVVERDNADARAASELLGELQAEQKAVHTLQQELRDQQTALVEQQAAFAEQHQEALAAQQQSLGSRLDDVSKVAAKQAATTRPTPTPAQEQPARAPQASPPQGAPKLRSVPSPAEEPRPEPQPQGGTQASGTKGSEVQGSPEQAPATDRPRPEPSIIPRTYTQPQHRDDDIERMGFDTQPRISENVNDLLDGVMDDVMGDITDHDEGA